MAKKKASKKKVAAKKKAASKKVATKKAASKKGVATTKTPKLDAKEKNRIKQLHDGLLQLYPVAECALTHSNAFELIIATILSAQCTDERVNMVTPALFKKYPTPQKMAAASQEDIEAMVRSTGFYRNKAKSLRETSKDIAEKFGGEVPRTMEELLTLRGVARKTANVVLGNAYGINVGVVVDTHVKRLSNRMGLTANANTDKIEKDLMERFPQDGWTMLSHILIFHGRQVCPARKPKCDQCTLRDLCPRNGVDN